MVRHGEKNLAHFPSKCSSTIIPSTDQDTGRETWFDYRNAVHDRKTAYSVATDFLPPTGGGNATSSPDQSCNGRCGAGKEVGKEWAPYLVPGMPSEVHIVNGGN
jgi:hypothetical protein